MIHEEIRNLKCSTCKYCLLRSFADKERKVCNWWGFSLFPDQRACSKHTTEPCASTHTSPILLKTINFPKTMCSLHDFSDERHKMQIDVACVQGVYYAGVHYQRLYDSMYGSGRCVSIYDGDFATADEAIKARIRELIRDEEYYRCTEAVQFLKSRLSLDWKSVV